MTPRDMMKRDAGEELASLMDLVRRLRAPDGCPWDRKQTPESAAAYLLEESYEAAEAIESSDITEIKKELGDVLFQIVFEACLFEERGDFDLAEVMREVRLKMIRRHPHVFGAEKMEDADQVRQLWGKIKDREREENGEGLLDSVPKGAPSLLRAHRLGERAARVGFDWDTPEGVWQKVLEELDEVEQALDRESQQAELGDLLFSLAQWARKKGFDAEATLRGANLRFQGRFSRMEHLAKEKGKTLNTMTMSEMDALWNTVKSVENPLDR